MRPGVEAGPEVVLCVNGPGELYTWAGPMLRALRARRSDLRVVLVLLPCQFATGHEARVGREMGFGAVVGVAEFLAFVAGGPKPAGLRGSRDGGPNLLKPNLLKPGLVLGLGGDVAYPGRLGRRLGYPAWRYSFEPYWHDSLERLYVSDEKVRARTMYGSPDERVIVVGNLVADALAAEPVPPKSPGLDVMVIAGSRRLEVVHLLGLFAAAAEQVARAVPGARFHWPRSRLLSQEALATSFDGRLARPLGGVPTRLEGDELLTPDGLRIRVWDDTERYRLMKMADLAITVPGTNTLELGLAGVPSVVSAPTEVALRFPIEGIAHYLSLVPGLGPWAKRRVVTAKLAGLRFVSLPNILANEAIQPELRGHPGPQDIADEAVRLLRDDGERARIRARLAATMPGPGAADRLARAVLERLALEPATVARPAVGSA